jgi:hypothetical protein
VDDDVSFMQAQVTVHLLCVIATVKNASWLSTLFQTPCLSWEPTMIDDEFSNTAAFGSVGWNMCPNGHPYTGPMETKSM